MSPRPRDHVLVVDNYDGLTIIGGVEVVFEEDGKVACITCCDPDNSQFAPQKDDIVEQRDVDEISDSIGEESADYGGGLLETLSMACANNCACQCTPYFPKSILKSGKLADSAEQRRQVSFSSHEIHEFDLTLGHHPAAVNGPPVMLDYGSEGTNRVVDVDVYEQERGPPRTRRQLKIHPQERKLILTHQKGFSDAEVNQAWAEAIQIRRQRQETLNRGLLMMLYDDVAESLARKYTRLLHSFGLP